LVISFMDNSGYDMLNSYSMTLALRGVMSFGWFYDMYKTEDNVEMKEK